MGFTLTPGRLRSVDAAAKTVTADDGSTHPYDALLVAIGARPEPALPHAVTFGGPQDAEGMHGVLEDLESGYAKRIAFVIIGIDDFLHDLAARIHQVGVQLAHGRLSEIAAHIGDVLAPALPSVAGRRHAGARAGAVHARMRERVGLIHPCAVSVG